MMRPLPKVLLLACLVTAGCNDEPKAEGTPKAERTPTPASEAEDVVVPREDVGTPAAVPESDDLYPDPPRYSVKEGTLWIDPIGCSAVSIPFVAPKGFVFDTKASLWRRTHGEEQWQDVQAKKAWFDFVELEVYCASRPDAAQRKAANAKRVYIDDQPEHPFSVAKDPELQAKRQEFEVLADEVDAVTPVLEFRNTYPDGVPRGFIYDRYEGRCWHQRSDAGVVLHVRVSTPIDREAEGRTWLTALCKPLATVAIAPG